MLYTLVGRLLRTDPRYSHNAIPEQQALVSCVDLVDQRLPRVLNPCIVFCYIRIEVKRDVGVNVFGVVGGEQGAGLAWLL